MKVQIPNQRFEYLLFHMIFYYAIKVAGVIFILIVRY